MNGLRSPQVGQRERVTRRERVGAATLGHRRTDRVAAETSSGREGDDVVGQTVDDVVLLLFRHPRVERQRQRVRWGRLGVGERLGRRARVCARQ